MGNKNGPIPQVHVSNDQTPAGLQGRLLYRLGGAIRWYLLAIIVYMLAAIGAAVYILLCPLISPRNRVLPIWNAEVNQFYSGLALSFLLTPAAVIIRQISHDFALLHPFAVASARPVSLSDLDTLMDPGLSASLRLFKYAPWTGFIQTLLMIAGVALVPVGTLTVYTGTYGAPLSGTAVVGMPTETTHTSTNMMGLYTEIGTGSPNGIVSNNNFFLNTSMNMFLGNIISQTGVVPETASQLGPSSTSNLTYEDTKRYSGIITYTWNAQCSYTDNIEYTEETGDSVWNFNFTIPNGDRYSNEDAWESRLYLSRKPGDNTTYFVVIGTDEETVNLAAAADASAISQADGAWISRVACMPTFSWQTSTCTWDERSGAMHLCTDQPGSNTTELDTAGMDLLGEHMSLVPLGIYSMNEYIYGLEALQTAIMFDPNGTSNHQYRAPVLADYTNMYGLVARALAAISTSGYYGTAVVPTEGSAPRPAYIVREYVLAVVLAILALPSLLCAWALVWARARGVPFRPATFLTVAAGTRGSWWDSALFGDCVMPHSQLLDKHRESGVMFGVDGDVAHVGFAPNAGPVMGGRALCRTQAL